jgi:hypothetical protein
MVQELVRLAVCMNCSITWVDIDTLVAVFIWKSALWTGVIQGTRFDALLARGIRNQTNSTRQIAGCPDALSAVTVRKLAVYTLQVTGFEASRAVSNWRIARSAG